MVLQNWGLGQILPWDDHLDVGYKYILPSLKRTKLKNIGRIPLKERPSSKHSFSGANLPLVPRRIPLSSRKTQHWILWTWAEVANLNLLFCGHYGPGKWYKLKPHLNIYLAIGILSILVPQAASRHQPGQFEFMCGSNFSFDSKHASLQILNNHNLCGLKLAPSFSFTQNGGTVLLETYLILYWKAIGNGVLSISTGFPCKPLLSSALFSHSNRSLSWYISKP